MSDPVPVHAGWAVWSKRPGSRDDYSVLASSGGPLSRAEFTRVLTHFAPGNPPADSGTPASLPWVVLSRVGVADQPHLGVSVQVPTSDVNGTGRPVSRTSYLCVRYEEVAGAPVSYRGLCHAVTATPLPDSDGALVPLAIPRLDAAELADAVLEFGPAVASTAALLLAGPVTITGPELPDTETRLRFLDAVAALLPYGYRTSFTAATWSDTAATGQRFRIVFALRARDEASRVPWGGAAPWPAAGPARAYLAHLQRVLGPPAADRVKLERLIGYLSSDLEPRKFEQPGPAVASLDEFFRAEVVGVRIDSGDASAADIRLLFARGQDAQLAPDRRRKALGQLIAAGEARDWPLVSERFGAVAEGDPAALLPGLVQGGRRLLWSAAATGRVADFLRLAAPYGTLLDDLLARLLVPSEAALSGPPGSLDPVAAVLAGFVLADPAALPRTRQALGQHPAVGPALLARLCVSHGQHGVARAVEWLEPVLDQILPAFNAVLGSPPEPVDSAAVHALAQHAGQLSVQYLLRAASTAQRLCLVLPAVTSWAVSQALRGSPPAARFWGEAAMELSPATVAEAAWLDLMLLATGNGLRLLFADRFPATQLSHGLSVTWAELAGLLAEQAAAADRLLTSGLIDFLGRYPWRTDAAQTAIVTDLAGWLTAGGARPALRMAVQDPAEALRQLPPQVTAEQIAAVCARGYADGMTAEQAGQALAQSPAIGTGAQAVAVLDALRLALGAAAAATAAEYPGTWLATLARMFARGRFGPQLAAEFAAVSTRSSIAELQYRTGLLYIAADDDAAESLLIVGEAELAALVKISKDLDELSQRIRKRQRKRKVTG